MMAPYIVDEAYDANGNLVYKGKAKTISNVFLSSTAEKLSTCMKQTILTGTSRKYFRRKGTSRDRFDIGGKTGTLSDAEDRTTLYTWFSGIAPLDSPNNVAIGTLVASPKSWIVRASSVAQTALAQFLRLTRLRHND
jgi:penicillin-binding protein A